MNKKGQEITQDVYEDPEIIDAYVERNSSKLYDNDFLEKKLRKKAQSELLNGNDYVQILPKLVTVIISQPAYEDDSFNELVFSAATAIVEKLEVS